MLTALVLTVPAKSQADAWLLEDEWYKSINASATDTTYSTAEVSKVFMVNKSDGYKYIFQMKGTRRNTTGDATFTIYGSIDGVQYYSIATRTWYTTTADTTIYFTTASNVGWRYIKGGLQGTATGTKLTLNHERLTLFK